MKQKAETENGARTAGTGSSVSRRSAAQAFLSDHLSSEEKVRLVFDGPALNLETILRQRELRGGQLDAWSRDMPEAAVIVMTLNIPGPVKMSRLIRLYFEEMRRLLKETLLINRIDPIRAAVNRSDAGDEVFLAVEAPAEAMKALTVDIEEKDGGRLVDIDVYRDGTAVSRESLGRAPRRCFLCGEDAKSCGRAAVHPLESLRAFVADYILRADN